MADNLMWNGPGTTPAGAPAAHQPPPMPDGPPAEPVVGRRTIAEITALLDNIRYAVETKGHQLEEFHEGVRAAYSWAVGRGPSPITDRAAGIPDVRQLRAEDDAAEDALRSSSRRRYANGVQHAVMWVRGATDDQPWLSWQ
ncbi:hypothetical protein ACIBEA_40305 [Streptomyces sp. NPDC051555]|uniref:hypothetical protein n=1 Tax=Streptomyces sp. NPDC051555 TaxID=3365657 RepID=UPI00378ECEFA